MTIRHSHSARCGCAAAMIFVTPLAPAQPSCSPGQFAAQVGFRNAPALDFNGSSHFVDLGDPPELNIIGAMTMEAWIRPDEMFGAHNVFTRGPGTLSGAEVSLRLDNNAYEVVSFDLAGTYGTQSTNTFAADTGTWVHLAATFSPSGCTLYRNGQIIAQNANPTGAVFAPGGWRIGTWNEDPLTTVRWFDGAIAEVRLWNIARTQSEIQAGMFAGVGGSPGLVGSWRLDDGAGLVALDSSGLDNHGTLVGPPAWISLWRDEDQNNILDACQPPTVVTQPQNFTGCDTAPLTLLVNATGTASAGFSYAWTRNGMPLAGQTSQTLFVERPTPLDNGLYTCIVRNGLNPALFEQSAPASVSVSTSLSLATAWGQSLAGETTIPTPPPGAHYDAFAAGALHSLALRSDGVVIGFGANISGQISVPPLPMGVTYTAVAAGDRFSLALRSNGTIAAFGDNAAGQLNVPALPMGVTYTAIAAGFSHALALRSDGVIAAWGDNGFGQLNVPAPPGGMSYTALAAGWLHSLALRSDGVIVAWGNNGFGQLAVPPLPPTRSYLSISAGAAHGAAVRSDGRLVAWGLNDVGQSSPPMPSMGAVFTRVACGAFHTIGLLSDGGATAFGESADGQTFVPQLAPGTRYSAIGSGPTADHSFAARRVIVSTPPDRAAVQGSSTTFPVSTPGIPGVTYRWRRNGADLANGPTGSGSFISGATTTTLSLSSIQPSDMAAYALRLIGPCDTAETAPAQLTVQSVCPGDADGDRTVGLPDLALIITYWSNSVPPAPMFADLDQSGSIGLGDVAQVISHWATSCP